jgi:PiT family inorganic phosphate transporter
MIVAFFASVLVAGNALSACVGTAIGARVLSQKSGALLGFFGFTLGLLIQGPSMLRSIQALLPSFDPTLSLVALSVTVLVFFIADLLRVPVPLTMSLVSLLAGLSIRNHLEIDSVYITTVILMWFLAPAVSAIAAFCILKICNRTYSTNVWRKERIYKILLLIFSVLTAYALGANTLGLIVALEGFNALTLLIAVFGIFVGSVYFSAGEIRRVGQEMFQLRHSNAFAALFTSMVIVECATVFGIPLSGTQTLSTAVVGAGMSYRTKYLSLKPFLVILLGWITVPLLSFAIALVI